jgi:hypothetical protein
MKQGQGDSSRETREMTRNFQKHFRVISRVSRENFIRLLTDFAFVLFGERVALPENAAAVALNAAVICSHR